MKDAYTLFYPPGGLGTFFIYFVSLHENFHTHKLRYVQTPFFIPYLNYSSTTMEDVQDESPVHCGLESINNTLWPDLVWKKIELPERDEPQVMSIKEYLKKFNDAFPESADRKIIFKQIPHARIVTKEHAYLKTIIFNTDNWDWLLHRNRENFKSLDMDIQEHRLVKETLGFLTTDLKFYKINKIANELNRCGADYCYIDVYKLFKFDITEYNNLLNYIGEPPLQNWREVINDYLEKIKLIL